MCPCRCGVLTLVGLVKLRFANRVVSMFDLYALINVVHSVFPRCFCEIVVGKHTDVLGIQLLRNRFAMLAMEAAEKSVQSPIVLPSDVNELQLGGDAIIRTANPAGVRRVELTLPQGAFTEQTILNQELRVGSRYPESRTYPNHLEGAPSCA